MRTASLLLLFACLLARAIASDLPDSGQRLPFHASLDHPWAGVLGQPFPVRFSLGSITGKDFTCTGRLLGDDGALLLSGDWDLVVQEISAGKVIASHSVRPPAAGPVGTMSISATIEHEPIIWDAQTCFTHPGNYRLRLVYGATGRTGELFRVDTTADPPPWVSLAVQPDRPRAMLGAPVRVDFIVTNHGSDDFHARFGCDAGPTRALRFHFTAVRSDGEPAYDPEPQPFGYCGGGLGRASDLAPGETEHEAVTLGAYLRFPGPGTYTVTAYHDLEFGRPVLPQEDGSGPYALAGTFTLTLDPPTPAGIANVVAEALAVDRTSDYMPLIAHLHEPFFLPALREALERSADAKVASILISGVDSVDTPDATRVLIGCLGDVRPGIRECALIRLRERVPLPLVGRWPQLEHDDRLHDARTALTWNDEQHQLALAALPALLASNDQEVFGAAAELAAVVGGDGIVETLATATDRFMPLAVPSDRYPMALGHLERVAVDLGRAGRPLCGAEATSPRGRLIFWAWMLQGSAVAASPAQEALLARMLESSYPLVRNAAFAAAKDPALSRLPVPWQALFMDASESVWRNALNRSMAVPLEVMRPLILACPQAHWDERQKREFARMLAMRAEHEERH